MGERYRLALAIDSTGDEPRTLEITCPGSETTVELGGGLTPPVVPLECHAGGDGDILVGLSVPETRVPGDGRPLGVALRDIHVTALDQETIAAWRLEAGLAAATIIMGIWLAVAALAGTRIATAAVLVSLVVALAISVRQPDWVGVVVTGPAGVITLAAGYSTWLLAARRRTGPFLLGLVAVATWYLLPPPDPARLLPALWTPHDSIGYQLLPWLAALAILCASLIGGRRAAGLSATATLIAAASLLVPVGIRPLLERWSLVINGPDWTGIAAPAGGLLLVSAVIVALIALRAQTGAVIPARLILLTVVAMTLAVLVPWRNAVMEFNGDEPHYYVTASSIARDADLELLDDYLDDEYLANTISPIGNIAVDRSTSTDRYVAFAPALDDLHYLIPDATSGVSPINPSGNPSASNNSPTFVDRDGDLEMLPSLTASPSLVIPISGPCHIESLWLAAVGDTRGTATVHLLDATGAQRWQESIQLSGERVSIQTPLDPTICTDAYAGALVIKADMAVIAQALDTASGLRILPARPAANGWLLGPLPRDRFATQDATTRVTLHNPGRGPLTATITLLTPHETLLRATDVAIPAGATVFTDVDLHGGAAVAITATAPLVAAGTGWQPGGSYSLPSMPGVTGWTLDIPPAGDRDAGLWLAFANSSPDQRDVTVEHGGNLETITICGFCADMFHIPSGETWSDVTLSTSDGPSAVAAIIYEERTGALHFDLGLSLLAALPIGIAGPDAAPLVSVIATILLAAGLFELLVRIGVPGHAAVWGVGAVALLAPLSPYSVRLYTEPLAACLVVWALVCGERARHRPVFAVAALLLAGALPTVHGRYAPLAFVLATLAIVFGARHARASRRQLLGLATFAIAFVAVIALSPIAVALRERTSAGYFSTEWVPHNLLGILIDRGSGLLPFAPWCLLAIAAGRRLHPLQRAAILLVAVQLSTVALRAGGWQTFGPPARYILPVVPLLALLAVPGALRLWRSPAGRAVVSVCLVWSGIATALLHWLPLSGYIYEGHYFITDVRHELPLLVPFDLLPSITPTASSNLLGIALMLAVWTAVWTAIRQYRH